MMLNKDETVQDLVTYSAEKPLLFFVGSGISIPYPACLPSAGQMIDLVAQELKPNGATKEEVAAICKALPELFYEALFGLIGKNAVLPWTALEVHKTQPNAFRMPIRPTLGHLATVYLSWKNALPIVTTNFDTLLESAAQALGLVPLPSLPTSTTWKRAEKKLQVAIWKVHGSADNPDSICTTLRQISTFNTSLLSELRDLCSSYLPCLLGYSGRDIDLFPFLASFSYPDDQPAFWLCSDFPPWHGIHTRPDKFKAIHGSINDFANCLIRFLKPRVSPHDAETLRILIDLAQSDLTSEQSTQYAEDNRGVYLNAARQIVREKILPLVVGPGGDYRLLLHAISLANVQRFALSARHAEKYIQVADNKVKPLWKTKTWILLSSCYHNLSKYQRSEHAARQALRIARRNRLTEEAVHALANLDEARRMQLDLSLRIGVPRLFPKILYLALVVRFFVDTLRLTRWVASTKIEQDRGRYDAIHSVLIEHRVRLLAMLQKLAVATVGRNVAAQLFSGLWKQLQRESYKAGYAAGVANALKYLERLRTKPSKDQRESDNVDELGIVSSRHVYELIAHKNGLALILRDEADLLVESGQIGKAAELYKQVADLARDLQNSSLELKALLGLHSCGSPVELNRIKEVIDTIEVYWRNAVKKTIIKKITG